MKPVRALLAISLFVGAGAAFPQSYTQPPTSTLPAAIGTYCVPCHNARLAEGKIALGALDRQHPWADADTWERVLRQLRARTMPPTDNPRPDSKTYDALVSELASSLDRGDPQHTPVVPQRVTDLELAARLAKLLWSGAPDMELLNVAKKGRLHDPAVLETQVRRMLADPKVAGLVGGFFDEWLGLNQLATMPADPAMFPEFDPPLREALRRETELFVESQLREDRPAVELWTAQYTYVNDRLARHYGIPNVAFEPGGDEFRRVTLEGTERAGLLGQGSFLVATSALTRHPAVNEPSTSPAARAKWIRIHFLGVPMRPPLPNLPQFQKGVLLSAQLRSLPDPSCTACHSNSSRRVMPWRISIRWAGGVRRQEQRKTRSTSPERSWTELSSRGRLNSAVPSSNAATPFLQRSPKDSLRTLWPASQDSRCPHPPSACRLFAQCCEKHRTSSTHGRGFSSELRGALSF